MQSLDTVRRQLSKMTDRLLFRLQDRAGLPLNLPIYQRDGVPIIDRGGVSLLEFAVEKLEAYHSLLGRYEYPDQYPIMGTDIQASAVRRSVGITAIPRVDITLRDALFAFYPNELLPRLCTPETDPDTFGETAYVDADLLELLHQRINLGRYVARVKAEQDANIMAIAHDSDALINVLRDPAQEDRVLAAVRNGAAKYGLDGDIAAFVFRWIIEQTIHVEVVYLQGLAVRKAVE